ncbi:Phosphate carrier protein, mitochondrial [Aphelenchoides besseyi]|nr:Phosphate carrier protein, mitochondrial [Aphelenchoides besseyi]
MVKPKTSAERRQFREKPFNQSENNRKVIQKLKRGHQNKPRGGQNDEIEKVVSQYKDLDKVLECLWRNRWTQADGLGALIIVPTRELAYQIFEVINKVGQNHNLSAALLIGGTEVEYQLRRLFAMNIIICTPGRLLQHLEENSNFNVDQLQILVIDEADRILDLGFQIQSYVVCEEEDKINFLWSFLINHKYKKSLIFVTCCRQARFLTETLRHLRPGLSVGRTARMGKNGEAVLVLTPSQEEPFVKMLNQRHIPIEVITPDERRIRDVRQKLMSTIATFPELKDFAQRSILDYARAIYFAKLKSYGLAAAPRIRFLKRRGIETKSETNSESAENVKPSLHQLIKKPKMESGGEMETIEIATKSSNQILDSADESDDEKDVFKVTRRDVFKSIEEPKKEELPTVSATKQLTKQQMVKRMLKKKNIVYNNRTVFNEDDGEVIQPQDKFESTDFNIEEAKQQLEAEDAKDKKRHKELLKKTEKGISSFLWNSDSHIHVLSKVVSQVAVTSSGDENAVEFGSAKFFLFCSISGFLSCGLTHTAIVPLDLIKCRIQENAYLWRTSLYLAASASAEFFADILLAPMEATKVRIQTSPAAPPTLRGCASLIYESEGLRGFYKGLPPLWMRQIPYTMMVRLFGELIDVKALQKFACFERTVELLYAEIVPKPQDQCTKAEQLVVTFVAGYIAGVFCAVVSHPADTIVSKLNQDAGANAVDILKKLGLVGSESGARNSTSTTTESLTLMIF